jgi:hypothetical protein
MEAEEVSIERGDDVSASSRSIIVGVEILEVYILIGLT